MKNFGMTFVVLKRLEVKPSKVTSNIIVGKEGIKQEEEKSFSLLKQPHSFRPV
jgi:hypothetical protein